MYWVSTMYKLLDCTLNEKKITRALVFKKNKV